MVRTKWSHEVKKMCMQAYDCHYERPLAPVNMHMGSESDILDSMSGLRRYVCMGLSLVPVTPMEKWCVRIGYLPNKEHARDYPCL